MDRQKRDYYHICICAVPHDHLFWLDLAKSQTKVVFVQENYVDYLIITDTFKRLPTVKGKKKSKSVVGNSASSSSLWCLMFSQNLLKSSRWSVAFMDVGALWNVAHKRCRQAAGNVGVQKAGNLRLWVWWGSLRWNTCLPAATAQTLVLLCL